MLYSLITGGFSNFDILAFVKSMLLSIPGFLLALSLHEAGHAFVAYRCGDNTAKMLGRLTVNPAKHIDPLGFLMMFLVGLGWAKPVPVNPRNFRNYRRDDLLVSLAGITMNLLMFLLGSLLLYIFVTVALCSAPEDMWYMEYFYVEAEDAILPVNMAYTYALNMNEYVIAPVFGSIAGYLYEMLAIFTEVNLGLALFNLLPVPPLDGYHVLNDLILKKSLFAQEKAVNIGRIVLYALVFTGLLSKGLSFVEEWSFTNLGNLAYMFFERFL